MSVDDISLQKLNEHKHPSLLVRQEQELFAVRKEKRDSILLRYMARRLLLMLNQFDQSAFSRRSRPLIYRLQERHERAHRLALYHPQDLLAPHPLSFVGFISGKQQPPSPIVSRIIQRADNRLVRELAGVPGILSYSSLELCNGDWCNLVIFSDASAKLHIKNSETHKYVAHHIARTYYQWIRLHSGIMPEGLDHMEMQLQKTRYYVFHALQNKPSLREIAYDTL